MRYEWQTIEQAAVTLGVSTRTLARRISQQQVESRIQNNRRELFIAIPDESEELPPEPQPAPSFSEAAPSPQTHFVDVEQVAATPQGESTEPALILAEDRAHRAEMTLTVIQQSVQMMQADTRRARNGARWAWGILGGLTVLMFVMVGWTATQIARNSASADTLRSRLAETRGAADDAARQLQRTQTELTQSQTAQAKAEAAAAELRERTLQAERRADDVSRLTDAIFAAARISPATQPAQPPSAGLFFEH